MINWIVLAAAIIWIIAMWYVVIYALRRGWGPYLRSKHQGKVRVNCKIKERQTSEDFDDLTWQPEVFQKVLLFECEDGVDRDYQVHDDLFDSVEIGDDGVLIYQGDLFVDFEARRPRQDAEKLYKRWTRI